MPNKTYTCPKCTRTFFDPYSYAGHMNTHRPKAKKPIPTNGHEETYNKFRTYINRLEEENTRLKKLLVKWEEMAGRLQENFNHTK